MAVRSYIVVYDGRDRRNKKQKILILKNKLKWLIEPIEPIAVRTYIVVYDGRDRPLYG